jgi:hypothetical protein
MEEMYIALPQIMYSGLAYQVTIKRINETYILNSVNILLDDKILIKIKEQDTQISFEISNAKDIATDFMSRRIKSYKPKKNTVTKKEAKQRAAENLMKQFNL